MIATVNPATGETVRTFAEHTDAEVEARLSRADAAFRAWRRSAPAERSRLLARAADLLEEDKSRLGALMVLEMGKTRRAAVAEVEKCASACRYYAEHAAAHLADEKVAHATVKFLPLGPVLAVMPWNFPFWQVFRFAAPALAAGNVGLLKHSSNVPQCALAIEEVLAGAGFPAGAFQTLLVSARRTEAIIADRRVVAVTLTGSEGAGSKVGEAAGRHLKKTVLELGGSDPFVVLPSADLAAAAKTAVAARMINNGQSCIAAKRFIVHSAVYDRFREAFAAGIARLKVGDPMADDTDVGPIATADGLDTLAEQVDRSVAAGARALHGGRRLPGPGYWYEPTLLADIPRSAPAFSEEVFGPVALLHRVNDLDEAIALANDSPYGLGSSVWTTDDAERRRLVEEIEAGCTFVNAMVVSDPRVPFGGVKLSGYGRELGSFGIREFVNIKTIVSA
jgi:succinate-semialdehyde dehydrogenase/glutarate-semialdehyde dehydrogenase